MATYRLYAKCEYCNEGHPLPFAISIDLRIRSGKSVGEIFNGKRLPDDIVSIINNKTQCSNSGNFFIQTDYNNVFFAPTGLINSHQEE